MPDKEFIFNGEPIRNLFPILKTQVNNRPLIYLDNAATTQKPISVINALVDYYTKYNSNVHRGAHYLANIATEKMEHTRLLVSQFINAKSAEEIIFTEGTTESINLLANTFAQAYIKPGDSIIVSALEHHSNLVPWQIVCQKYGAKLKIIPLNDALEIDIDAYKNLLDEKVKIVAVTYVSNTIGTINPVKLITDLAHKNGSFVLIDTAQAIKHTHIDVQQIDCDFIAFSSHKMYGPMGVGILYGKGHLLDSLPVWQTGGEMVKTVTYDQSTYNKLPYKFEAGTPNVADIVAFCDAINFINSVDIKKIHLYEQQLMEYAIKQLSQVKGIQILGSLSNRANVISFISDKMHHYDIGVLLDKMGVAIRTGNHCTEPLMNYLKITGTSRASCAIYNTMHDIDNFIINLTQILEKYGNK
ncbi:MAG: SufS family cysteine desulfurase [Solitalea-like symbiont of Acarus siro]